MKQTLIGRELEVKLLREYLNTDKSEFVVVYGRRRVGKTYLIRQVLGDQACFSMTGMENAGMGDQLSNFYFSLLRVWLSATHPKSWIEAFYQLQSFLESLPEGRKIVFIDELPWMDTTRSKFLAALERFWNGWADGRSDIKLIVCGSATSWMIDNIINNRGGLHNRRTHQIYIAPFTLEESRRYFKAYGFGYREKEIAECYMVMGGVAYYYSLMNPKESVAQNIDRLFFLNNGELVNEFENLYRSLFKKAGDHITIVTVLAKKGKGLSRKQIIEQSRLNNNKKFTKTLEELEKCGFIRSYIPFGETKRDILFQLTDAFTLFHFHYIKENKYQDETFWTNSLNSGKYRAWSGYAFEILCLNHIRQIKQALGISGIQSRACCWSSKGDDSHRGAQIDLIIDRADQTVNICEMKFSRSDYEITKSEAEDLDNKLDMFLRQTNTRKSLMLTMITSFGIKPGIYSGRVQVQVTLEDLFK
ncbi:MAG: AAA family ATPase [Bacteroidaceae bacterium]|nr:AAA family ATPase [Bacteroidaceae bacterium]